jgi:enamine deaminase RidA (YjgF/YER057c/UK114 family)
MSVEERLEQLGLEIPSAATPMANYVPAARTGNLVFLSGHGPVEKDRLITGRLGSDLTVEEGYRAARVVALGLLGSLKALIGDLERVRRIVKLLGMVNCDADFKEQPQVINGASDLLVEIFGDRGRHARSAVGMNALPLNIPVEIEMIVEVEDG